MGDGSGILVCSRSSAKPERTEPRRGASMTRPSSQDLGRGWAARQLKMTVNDARRREAKSPAPQGIPPNRPRSPNPPF
jgi:hypothetical protein